jgi:ArsR family transcriptional regulator
MSEIATPTKPSTLKKKPPKSKPISAEARDLAHLAKALGHPIRIEILKVLMRKKECVCGELVSGLPLSQATISQHLKVLKNAGFIRGQVSGVNVCYCIDRKALRKFTKLMERFLK